MSARGRSAPWYGPRWPWVEHQPALIQLQWDRPAWEVWDELLRKKLESMQASFSGWYSGYAVRYEEEAAPELDGAFWADYAGVPLAVWEWHVPKYRLPKRKRWYPDCWACYRGDCTVHVRKR